MEPNNQFKPDDPTAGQPVDPFQPIQANPGQANLHTNPKAPNNNVSPDPIQPEPERFTPPQKPSKKPRGYAWRGFMSIAQLVGGAVLLAFIINQFIFQSYQVFGASMTPTLHEGDRLIISKVGKSWSTLFQNVYIPKRGEIVVFHNPRNPDIQLVKRVVGLPGDRVVVQDGAVTVTEPDGITFNYNDEFDLDSLQPTVGVVDVTVPEGEIFVIGDNRAPGGSLDSRNELGTIPSNQLVGDLVLRIFPINQAELF